MLEDWFKPRTIEITAVERTPAEQREVDALTANMALYHYDSCMFCARVRKAIAALGLNIEHRNIMENAGYRRELAEGGGRSTVPCLRIGDGGSMTEWMYESSAIIRYLAKRFSGDPSQQHADGSG